MNDLIKISHITKKIRMLTLGYWGIRGRAQVARNLLAYTGTEFKDKAYTKPE